MVVPYRRSCIFQREGGSKKKKKDDRDPNKPKRPQTAYFLWFMSERENIKTANPGFSVVDITKKAGELWKGLTPEEKKVTKYVLHSLIYVQKNLIFLTIMLELVNLV